MTRHAVASIVGARPQFVKLAPICRAFAEHSTAVEHLIVHTGQHYDHNMSDVFFAELDLPKADVNLEVGSGGHGKQTAMMLERLEALFTSRRIDAVVVYGDTNSTVAGALAAAKLHIPLVHVEAGLRSFNRRMPEELNRIVADHLCDILLAPTPTAVANLQREGLADRTRVTGDVMLDVVRTTLPLAARKSRVLERLALGREQYAVATVHRAENTDTGRLAAIMSALSQVAREGMPVVLPLHPRTAARLKSEPGVAADAVRVIEPLGYLDMLQIVANSRLVLTDSGGLQKEAFFLGRPCVTMRDETEWVETVDAGANIVSGGSRDGILGAVARWQQRLAQGPVDLAPGVAAAFGNGRASVETVAAVLELLRGNVNKKNGGGHD
jgi:UDP-N-acetylglucosamine 2-epimerase